MRHDVGVEWPNQSEEISHVNFVIYGNPNKYSAMAATVGYPTAIATKMVLEGTPKTCELCASDYRPRLYFSSNQLLDTTFAAISHAYILAYCAKIAAFWGMPNNPTFPSIAYAARLMMSIQLFLGRPGFLL